MVWEGMSRRKFPRVSYRCLIKMTRSGKQETVDTFTENIGSGGICVVLEDKCKLFETVSLEIFFDEGEDPVLCEGSVVWIVKRHPMKRAEKVTYDTGIEFKNISAEDRERITRLVQNILDSEA